MRPIEQVWCAFFRDGLEPDGRWYAWERTVRDRRSDVTDVLIAERYVSMRTRADHRNLRRRGVVKVCRTTLWADLPEASDV